MARYSCPQIRPEEYKWKQSNTDPALWQRRACGVEAVIAIEASKQQGHSGLFFSAKVQLWSDSHNLSNVTEAARCAWLKLRLKHPEIACFPGYDRQQKGLIQYRAPQDHQEANQWAEKTIIVKASHGTPLAIPDSLTTTRKDAVSGFYAVTVHITASVESESVPLGETELHFLFHANHLFFDGIGLRQLIGIFFNILAQTLSSDLPRGLKPLAWQNSAQNLSSAVIELMDPAQNVSGLAFEKSLRLMMGYVLRNSHSWGMDTLKLAEGVSRVSFHTFTKQESEEITRNVKQNIGSQYNITHLAQIAILLTVLKIKPPIGMTPNHQLFLCQSPINCRRFMIPQIAKQETPYFPNSQSIAAIVFENIKDYYVPEEEQTREKMKQMLVKGIKVAEAEYTRELNLPHQLSASISLMEVAAAAVESEPSIEDTAALVRLQHLLQRNFTVNLTSNEMLTSDGITERYIAQEYFADASEKKKMFSVNDVFFSMNQVNSSVRLSTFRDRARLSVEFNTKFHTMETMQSFLTSIADYMKVFAVM